jgi:hypothetical protein
MPSFCVLAGERVETRKKQEFVTKESCCLRRDSKYRLPHKTSFYFLDFICSKTNHLLISSRVLTSTTPNCTINYPHVVDHRWVNYVRHPLADILYDEGLIPQPMHTRLTFVTSIWPTETFKTLNWWRSPTEHFFSFAKSVKQKMVSQKRLAVKCSKI